MTTPKRYFQVGNRSYEQQPDGTLKRIPNILKHGFPGVRLMPSDYSVKDMIEKGFLSSPQESN